MVAGNEVRSSTVIGGGKSYVNGTSPGYAPREGVDQVQPAVLAISKARFGVLTTMARGRWLLRMPDLVRTTAPAGGRRFVHLQSP